MSFFGIKFSDNIYNYLSHEQNSLTDSDESFTPSSGVCDSPEQFAKCFPHFSGDVYFKYIQRYKQPSENGWKWQGAGKYYGEYDLSTVEYLYQANGKKGRPQIDCQCIFALNEPTNSHMFDCVFIDHGKVM